MKNTLLNLFCLLAILALLPFSGNMRASAKSGIPEKAVPESITSKAQELTVVLEEQGFEVSQGYMTLYTEAECPTSFAEVGTCFGNNPAAPYVTLSIPPWPKEFIDPATDEALGPLTPGFHSVYRFDPREAIVILGLMPPPADYLGLQSYVFTRQENFNTKSTPYQWFSNTFPAILDVFFSEVPQNHRRVISSSSLSNSINHVVIERQSGEVFDQERFFIVTPDQYMDQAVRQAFSDIQVDDTHIFTEPIPNTVRTGLNKPADDFYTIIRYAMPEDGGGEGTPSDLWNKNPPVVVLRVRDTTPGRIAEKYPPVVLEDRDANDELYLKPDLLALAHAVGARWGQPCVDQACTNLVSGFFKLRPPPISMVGPECIKIGMNCQADTEDALYQYTKSYVVDDDVVYAAAGTLGTVTGNATYVGFGLMATMRQLGFANLSDEQLLGTASNFAAQVNNTDKFYLYYFARDCSDLVGLTDDFCMEISIDDLPPCNDLTSKTCDNLKFSVRDYMRPGTQRGPAAELKLPSIVITLHRP